MKKLGTPKMLLFLLTTMSLFLHLRGSGFGSDPWQNIEEKAANVSWYSNNNYIEDLMKARLSVEADPIVPLMSTPMGDPVTGGTPDKNKQAVQCPSGKKYSSCLGPRPLSNNRQCNPDPYFRGCPGI